MTDDEWLAHFNKYIQNISRRIKGSNIPYFHRPHYNEEDLVVSCKGEYSTRTERTPVSESVNNRRYVPVDKVQNNGSRTNRKDILVSMKFFYPEGTEDQYFTSLSGETLVWGLHMKHSKRNSKSQHRSNQGFRGKRKWNNGDVTS